MAKTNVKGKEKRNEKLIAISSLVFAVVVAGCISFLLWERNSSHQNLCSVLGVDQISGLVLLDCVKK